MKYFEQVILILLILAVMNNFIMYKKYHKNEISEQSKSN